MLFSLTYQYLEVISKNLHSAATNTVVVVAGNANVMSHVVLGVKH